MNTVALSNIRSRAHSSAESFCQIGCPCPSRRITTLFLLSSNIYRRIPMYRKAWSIPINRFYCPAFGKNSIYRCPQQWQIMAKNAMAFFIRPKMANLKRLWVVDFARPQHRDIIVKNCLFNNPNTFLSILNYFLTPKMNHRPP